MAVVLRPQTLPSLLCRDGARRVFTDQANIACTKREAPRGVLESRMKHELQATKNQGGGGYVGEENKFGYHNSLAWSGSVWFLTIESVPSSSL